MTFDELRKSIGENEVVYVFDERCGIGKVTQISWNRDGSPRGCSVNYPGHNYSKWYWNSPATDKRSRYLCEIQLATKQNILNQQTNKC